MVIPEQRAIGLRREAVAEAREFLEFQENDLRQCRTMMRERGVTPPKLPPEMAHIDPQRGDGSGSQA